jgi:hypothetical protein
LQSGCVHHAFSAGHPTDAPKNAGAAQCQVCNGFGTHINMQAIHLLVS